MSLLLTIIDLAIMVTDFVVNIMDLVAIAIVGWL